MIIFQQNVDVTCRSLPRPSFWHMPRSHWQGPDAKEKIGVKKGEQSWDFNGIFHYKMGFSWDNHPF